MFVWLVVVVVLSVEKQKHLGMKTDTRYGVTWVLQVSLGFFLVIHLLMLTSGRCANLYQKKSVFNEVYTTDREKANEREKF